MEGKFFIFNPFFVLLYFLCSGRQSRQLGAKSDSFMKIDFYIFCLPEKSDKGLSDKAAKKILCYQLELKGIRNSY